jgi:NitT/TauT family transport system ATP-binding protein
MSAIVLDRVSKSFAQEDHAPRAVLSDVTLRVPEGTFTTLLGPNGSGKTTLLNLVAGLLRPDTGTVEIQVDHGGKPQIGFVWQDYRASLLPWFDVGENITFPLRLRGVERRVRRQTAEAVLERFLPHPKGQIRAGQRCYVLSGGQQQLVSLLRSLACAPDALLFDEPFSALDQQTRWNMAFHLERVWMERPVPSLFISHDVDEAILLADEVLMITARGGRVEHRLRNELPRPRSVKMLTSREHVAYRQEAIDFLYRQGVVREGSD